MKTMTLLVSMCALCIAACADDPPAGTTDNRDTIPVIDSTDTDTTDVDTNSVEPPAIQQDYDETKGGVQITRIFYNQGKNQTIVGLLNEWIVLTARGTVDTQGWKLNAGDPTQNYPLPAAISDSLVVYTRGGASGAHEKGLGLNVWIWNNSDPDTATVYNANNVIIDRLSYDN